MSELHARLPYQTPLPGQASLVRPLDSTMIAEPTSALNTESENHLGYPRFARMALQAPDVPSPDALRVGDIALDLLLSLLSILIVCYAEVLLSRLGRGVGWNLPRVPYGGSVHEFLAFLLLYSTVTVLACGSYGLYEMRRVGSIPQATTLFKAIGLSTGLVVVFRWLSGLDGVSPVAVGCAGVMNVAAFASWRIGKGRFVTERKTRRVSRNVLIVGSNGIAHELAESLKRNPQLGYAVVGFISESNSGDAALSSTGESDSLGRIDDLSRVARAHFIDEVLIAPPIQKELVRKVLTQARLNRLDVKAIPEIYEEMVDQPSMEFVGDIPLISLHKEPIPANLLVIKRIIDLVLSSIAISFSSPFLLLIAVAIKLDSKGPVFYVRPRVGKKGHNFTFYKFRTMVVDADQRKELLRKENHRSGPCFKIPDDPRITRVGKLLRKFSLDELPQLWNVLIGDMSLVGPRPHPIDDYAQYKLEYLRRLDVMPGITGLWQVSARNDRSFDRNLQLDLEYIENWSPWEDMKILLKTLPAILRAQGE